MESASIEAADGEVLGECLRFKLVRRTVASPGPKCFGASESDARCGKGILDAYAVIGAVHEDILCFFGVQLQPRWNHSALLYASCDASFAIWTQRLAFGMTLMMRASPCLHS